VRNIVHGHQRKDMDIPDIVGADESSSSDDKSRNLFFLGRRLERLFLAGVLLIILSFLSVLITTANKQLKEDHASTSLVLIEDRLVHDQDHLDDLYRHKDDPPARIVTPPSAEEFKALSKTRKSLGLPPLATAPIAPQAEKPRETYADALNKIVVDVAVKTEKTLSDLTKLVNSALPPQDLIAAVNSQRLAIAAKPTMLWGIETPRMVRLKYADQDYGIPYDVIAILLMLPLPILILGWLAALYMTRQRELLIIAGLRDYKLAFPHILNFLPVDLGRFFPINPRVSKRSAARAQRVNRNVLVFVRAAVLLLFASPMIMGFAYSLLTSWEVAAEPVSAPFAAGAFLTTVMLVQTIALIVQEARLLHGKLFTE
jgi:hypothetical protein